MIKVSPLSFMRRLALPLVLLLSACSAGTPPAADHDATASVAAASSSSVASSSPVASSAFSSGKTAVWTETPFAGSPDGFTGVVTVTGVLETERRANVDCTYDCADLAQDKAGACIKACPTHLYAWLVLKEPVYPALQAFNEDGIGNSFIREGAVGIGCLDLERDGTFRGVNFSDAFGERTISLSGEAAAGLLNSTSKPVTLRLRMEPSSIGRDAPDCYTHFTDVQVLPE